MPFKIVRNDITKMNTEAIVNTANEYPVAGPGCDSAVYKAAGYEELLAYRTEKIGVIPEGEVFITPGFALSAKYIIHAVSPLYISGDEGEEEKLRSCYRKSLALAKEQGIRSIAFPLISTGSFGYPKEEGLRIALDEINAFLLGNEMEIYLVVFGEDTTALGTKLYPDLEAYIDRNYVDEKLVEEYGAPYFDGNGTNGTIDRRRPDHLPGSVGSYGMHAAPGAPGAYNAAAPSYAAPPMPEREKPSRRESIFRRRRRRKEEEVSIREAYSVGQAFEEDVCEASYEAPEVKEPEAQEAPSKFDTTELPDVLEFAEAHESKLEERMRHLSDTFSEYLMYLIGEKHLKNADVYKRAIIDRKVFSKIKNNPDYHPQKLTALCLCVGAMLNLDESKDLLARAGYALSPCDKTDIIFSYFIENEIYDMIELDIQLEEHGLPCIIE